MIPAEVKFRHVPLEVLLTDMVERAGETALQQTETRLGRIRMYLADGVLAPAVQV